MLASSPPLPSSPLVSPGDDTLVRTTSQRGGARPTLKRTSLSFSSPSSSSYFPSTSSSSSAVPSSSSSSTIIPAAHHPRSRSIPEPLSEPEPLGSTASLLLAPTGGRPLPALRRHKSLNARPSSSSQAQPSSSLFPPPPLPFPRSPGPSTTSNLINASKHLPPNRVFHLLHNPPAPTPIPPRLLQASFIRRSTSGAGPGSATTPSVSGVPPSIGGRSRTNSVGSSSGGGTSNNSNTSCSSGYSSSSSSSSSIGLGSISSDEEQEEDDAVKEEEELRSVTPVGEEKDVGRGAGGHHRRGGSLGGSGKMKLNGLCL